MLSDLVFFDHLPAKTAKARLSSYNLGPTPQFLPFVFLAVALRASRAVTIHTFLHPFVKDANTSIAIYTWQVFALASIALLLVVRPWQDRRGITGDHWKRITFVSALTATTFVLFLTGLEHAGPMRAQLLEYTELLFLFGASLVSAAAPIRAYKLRAAVFIILAVIILCFTSKPNQPQLKTVVLSSEEAASEASRAAAAEASAGGESAPSVVYGIGLLLTACVVTVIRKRVIRKLALELGSGGKKESGPGRRRIYALVIPVACALMTPFALYSYMTGVTTVGAGGSPASASTDSMSELIVIFLAAVTLCLYNVADTYIDVHVSSETWVPASVFVMFIVTCLAEWSAEFSFYSFGTFCAFTLIAVAVHALAKVSEPKGQGDMLSYGGLPIVSGSIDEAGLGGSGSISPSVFRQVIRSVLENDDSRKIFIFLSMNFAFMFVELLWGIVTNSLGLISDAAHMMFDCGALAIGLWASVISKWKSDDSYTYGYGRYEVLSGFCNGILLLFVAFFVLMEGVERLLEPPNVSTDHLLLVAVLGLLVNLVGLFFFHDLAGDHAGHSHSHSAHGHSHGHSANANMVGVYLHVLADTMGSVGVIVSTLLLQYFDIRIADPIASVFIAVLIALSVIPLLKSSANILLQRTPEHFENEVPDLCRRIQTLPGVLSYHDVHFWTHAGESTVGSICVVAHQDADEQKLRMAVTQLLREYQVAHVVVQVEKEGAFTDISLGGGGASNGGLGHRGHDHGHDHSHGHHDSHDHGHHDGHDKHDHHDHHDHHGHSHSHDHSHGH